MPAVLILLVAAITCLVMALSHDWPAGGYWFAATIGCLWLMERKVER